MAMFFEDLDNGAGGNGENNKPFFSIDRENDKELMEWLQKTMVFLKNHNQQRLNKVKNNYARYKGIQYREQVFQPRDLPEKRIRYMPQVVVPIIADAVDEKVARLLEYKPSIQVIPNNDEQKDKIAAKTAKKFLSHVEQAESLDEKFRRAVRSSKVGGESFVFVVWNTDKGKQVLPMGAEVTGLQGQVIRGPINEGDVSCLNATTLEVLYEKAKCWDSVEYIFWFDNEYTEKLKLDYPEASDKLHPNKATTYYDFETMDMKSLEGMSTVITFFHKRTKYLPGGFECKFTGDVILKKGDITYKHNKLPCVRFVDVENEEELSGQSFIEKLRGMASLYNNIKNLITKQLMLAAHPKWFVDGGSVDDQALGNDISIVKLKPGSRQPVLAQGNPVSPQMFEYAQEQKNEFYEMAKSNSVVRGEPPPGVTAFVALQYVSESENRRISSDVANVNKAIKDVYDMCLKVCAQFYKKEDKRTMMLLGKDNRWTYAYLDPEDLARPYSLILQNASALPESKALRTQFVLDMGKTFPQQFPPEQIAEMLDLGQSEKMMDLAAMAARAAEDENEIILDGSGVPDPQMFENLIVHWRVHLSAIQDIGFKTKSAPKIQEAMKDHIMATEMLMDQMSKKNPTFQQQLLLDCPQFPVFFNPILPPPPEIGLGGAGGIASQPAEMLNSRSEQPTGINLESAPRVKPLPGDMAYSPVKSPQETGAAPQIM